MHIWRVIYIHTVGNPVGIYTQSQMHKLLYKHVPHVPVRESVCVCARACVRAVCVCALNGCVCAWITILSGLSTAASAASSAAASAAAGSDAAADSAATAAVSPSWVQTDSWHFLEAFHGGSDFKQCEMHLDIHISSMWLNTVTGPLKAWINWGRVEIRRSLAGADLFRLHLGLRLIDFLHIVPQLFGEWSASLLIPWPQPQLDSMHNLKSIVAIYCVYCIGIMLAYVHRLVKNEWKNK